MARDPPERPGSGTETGNPAPAFVRFFDGYRDASWFGFDPDAFRDALWAILAG